RESLADLKAGPLALHADDLIIAEQEDDGHFTYTHYGENIAQASGFTMFGKSTADFVTGVGAFFAQSYREALSLKTPIYAVNKAKMTHRTHSWQRVLFPV
ncbi:unnamed protein product, partial [Ectocarpus sp. 12 AP-2014]